MRTEEATNWIKNLPEAPVGWINDIAIADYIAPFITGYMDKPVILVDDKPVAALSFGASSIDEIFEHVARRSITDHLYLMGVYYYPSVAQYHYIDPTTFEAKTHDRPIMGPSTWKIRIGAVPK